MSQNALRDLLGYALSQDATLPLVGEEFRLDQEPPQVALRSYPGDPSTLFDGAARPFDERFNLQCLTMAEGAGPALDLAYRARAALHFRHQSLGAAGDEDHYPYLRPVQDPFLLGETEAGMTVAAFNLEARRHGRVQAVAS